MKIVNGESHFSSSCKILAFFVVWDGFFPYCKWEGKFQEVPMTFSKWVKDLGVSRPWKEPIN